MEQFMWCFISGLFISFFMVFFWNSLLKNDINYKQPKIYISVVVISLSAVLVQFVLPQYLKLTSDILIFMIVNYIFYCRNITKNLLIVIYSDIVMFAGEAIFVLLISFAFKDSIDVLYNLSFGSLIINIAVTIICFILIKFKFIYKIFDYSSLTFRKIFISCLTFP